MKEEEKYLCPITGQIMVEPVVDALGNTYDKAAIKKWLETNNTTPTPDPETGELKELPEKDLRDATKIFKAEITEYKKEKITKGLVILPKLLK